MGTPTAPGIGRKPDANGQGGYCCPCAVDSDPCTCGSFTAQCRTRSGSAALCGFSEFGIPSAPPKKYKMMGLSGSLTTRIPYNDETCTGTASGTQTSSFSGWALWSTEPCAMTNNSHVIARNASDQVLYDRPASIPGGCGGNSCAMTVSCSKTVFVETGTGNCCYDYNTDFFFTINGERRYTLSDEDKESDAIARASKDKPWSAWSDCSEGCAFITKRPVGEFSFGYQEAEVKFTAKGSPNAVVKIEITYTQTDLASGGITAQKEMLELWCDGAGDANRTVKVPCESGKKTCATWRQTS